MPFSEEFQTPELDSIKTLLQNQKAAHFHSFSPTPTSQGICGHREESSQCRLKCGLWK